MPPTPVSSPAASDKAVVPDSQEPALSQAPGLDQAPGPSQLPGSSQATSDQLASTSGVPTQFDKWKKTSKKRLTAEAGDDPDSQSADYVVPHKGGKLTSNQVRDRLTQTATATARLPIDDLIEAALKDATLGYFMADLVEPTQALATGYINCRSVNKEQSELLRKQMIIACHAFDHPLFAAVVEDDCFVDEQGEAMQLAPTLDVARRGWIRQGRRVWRISGGHRTDAVRTQHKLTKSDADEMSALYESLVVAGNETVAGKKDLQTAEAQTQKLQTLHRLVDQNWRHWPVRVFSKREYEYSHECLHSFFALFRAPAHTTEKLDQPGKLMATVRAHLASNQKEHQWEGTPREMFQICLQDPDNAMGRLSQQSKTLWTSKAFMPLIEAWVPFTGFEDINAFQIGMNDRRARVPWIGAWTKVVTSTLKDLTGRLKPPRNDDYISSIYFGLIDSTFLVKFDIAFNQTLLPLLKQGHICDALGIATDEWRDAYNIYLSKIRKELDGLRTVIRTPSSSQPADWPEHREAALDALIGSIKVTTTEIAQAKATGLATPLMDVLPLFSNEFAEALAQVCNQSGPAISLVSDIGSSITLPS